MSNPKATHAFTFREGGKVTVYKKGQELSGAALAHAQANGFAPKPEPEKPKAEAKPAAEPK
ncbi:hypothetical protein N878_02770 [Pseudomonas sp. EGD-AK9]|uniref:hypothetical protein n=1 Tax=Pseudomonas sp. EGD-AK9 TaxID=1386078 RepID=UPI000397906F|nr:hypothetical protein [Pseudomonas sp. EGD-AK9]ERI54097.1 hypothetical protein N878_02770 [Pseudomonas sp. EGD-AK9]